jgi:hypothetical protein
MCGIIKRCAGVYRRLEEAVLPEVRRKAEGDPQRRAHLRVVEVLAGAAGAAGAAARDAAVHRVRAGDEAADLRVRRRGDPSQ